VKQSYFRQSPNPRRLARSRARFHLPLPGGGTLIWSIRRLPRIDFSQWRLGFPYFGETADTLAAWGLHSRGAVMAVLNRSANLTLGDRVYHRIRGRSILIADLSLGFQHQLRTKA